LHLKNMVLECDGKGMGREWEGVGKGMGRCWEGDGMEMGPALSKVQPGGHVKVKATRHHCHYTRGRLHD